MSLKKELTVHSCTAARLTYFKIKQWVGRCCHRSLWQTAPCVFVRQQMPATQVRAIPSNSHTPPCHPAPLVYRRDKLTPFYSLWSKVPTQSDIPQKDFKDQRRQCGDGNSSLNLCDFSFQKIVAIVTIYPLRITDVSIWSSIIWNRSSIFWPHLERTQHDPEDCKGTRLGFQLRRNDSRLLNL